MRIDWKVLLTVVVCVAMAGCTKNKTTGEWEPVLPIGKFPDAPSDDGATAGGDGGGAPPPPPADDPPDTRSDPPPENGGGGGGGILGDILGTGSGGSSNVSSSEVIEGVRFSALTAQVKRKGNVIVSFQATAVDKDRVLTLDLRGSKGYDQRGNELAKKKVRLGGKIGHHVRKDMIRGKQQKGEVVFDTEGRDVTELSKVTIHVRVDNSQWFDLAERDLRVR